MSKNNIQTRGTKAITKSSTFVVFYYTVYASISDTTREAKVSN